MRYLLSFFVVSVLLLGACSNAPELPSVALSEKKIVAILTDIELLKARDELYRNMNPKALDSIYIRHKIQKADLNAWLRYYAEKPDLYISIRQKVIEKLSKERVFVNTSEMPK